MVDAALAAAAASRMEVKPSGCAPCPPPAGLAEERRAARPLPAPAAPPRSRAAKALLRLPVAAPRPSAGGSALRGKRLGRSIISRSGACGAALQCPRGCLPW